MEIDFCTKCGRLLQYNVPKNLIIKDQDSHEYKYSLCNSCRDKLIKELNVKENETEESIINGLELIKNNKDLHEDLLEVIKPYLDAFTGYNEETHMFDIVQAVKEIIEGDKK